MVKWSLTKLQRQYNRAKIVFSTNGARTIGHACAKKKNKESRQRPYSLHKHYHKPKCKS